MVTAYLLAVAVVMPVYGKAGDLFGRKPVFQFAIVLFLAGSAASGLAHSMDQLIAFRAAQGAGAGALPPLYAYLIPLLAVAFLLALILKEIPLRTRRDAAQAAPRSREHALRAPQPPDPARPGRPPAPPHVAATPTALGRPRLPHRWNNPPAE